MQTRGARGEKGREKREAKSGSRPENGLAPSPRAMIPFRKGEGIELLTLGKIPRLAGGFRPEGAQRKEEARQMVGGEGRAEKSVALVETPRDGPGENRENNIKMKKWSRLPGGLRPGGGPDGGGREGALGE